MEFPTGLSLVSKTRKSSVGSAMSSSMIIIFPQRKSLSLTPSGKFTVTGAAEKSEPATAETIKYKPACQMAIV